MAERIGNEPIGFVRTADVILDVPELLSTMCVSEEHTKHIQALQLFAQYLDVIAHRAIKVKDPVITETLFKMKLLKVLPPINEGEHFEDI